MLMRVCIQAHAADSATLVLPHNAAVAMALSWTRCGLDLCNRVTAGCEMHNTWREELSSTVERGCTCYDV